MVALVATIHVFTQERPGERRFIGWRLPSASQDVDARDKPEHDGKARDNRYFTMRSFGLKLSSSGLCPTIGEPYIFSNSVSFRYKVFAKSRFE